MIFRILLFYYIYVLWYNYSTSRYKDLLTITSFSKCVEIMKEYMAIISTISFWY